MISHDVVVYKTLQFFREFFMTTIVDIKYKRSKTTTNIMQQFLFTKTFPVCFTSLFLRKLRCNQNINALERQRYFVIMVFNDTAKL